MKPIRRIIFATDFSSTSRRAFATAIAMAKSLRGSVTIVYVMAPVVPAVPEVYLDAITMDHLEQQANDWTMRQLKRLADRARKSGVTTTIQLREGEAAEQIVGAAKALKAGLVVVGTHGRRGLPKFFLGSVAERVVAMSPCPVMTVRGS